MEGCWVPSVGVGVVGGRVVGDTVGGEVQRGGFLGGDWRRVGGVLGMGDLSVARRCHSDCVAQDRCIVRNQLNAHRSEEHTLNSSHT